MGLVFSLAFRLREQELQNNFEIGASRWTTARLLAAELVLLAGVSTACVIAVLSGLEQFGAAIVRSLFVT